MSTVFKKFLKKRGREHMSRPADTPQYFSMVERANRTIVEMSESMRKIAQMTDSAWGYARKCAAYIRNRCPTKSNLNNMNSYQVRTGKLPNLEKIRIFGAPCIAKQKERKLEDRFYQEDLCGF